MKRRKTARGVRGTKSARGRSVSSRCRSTPRKRKMSRSSSFHQNQEEKEKESASCPRPKPIVRRSRSVRHSKMRAVRSRNQTTDKMDTENKVQNETNGRLRRN